MPVLSNNVKVSLFHFNILEQNSADRSSSVAVQHYDYTLSRQLNAYGEAYGNNAQSIMLAAVRVGSRDDLKVYYDDLNNSYPSSFTFVMNARYDESGRLSDYDGAMVCEGYIVDVEEFFSRGSASLQGQQMSLVFKILLTRMEFVGSGRNLVQRFTDWTEQ